MQEEVTQKTIALVSFLQIVAPELSDRMLADFMDAENGIIVNLHIQSIDHKRPFQQHDFVRPKEAEKSQRLDTRHTGQRQKFFCKTRNHKRFSYHVRRHYHLRPRSRILPPCRTFERTGYQGFAEQYAVH